MLNSLPCVIFEFHIHSYRIIVYCIVMSYFFDKLDILPVLIQLFILEYFLISMKRSESQMFIFSSVIVYSLIRYN